MIHATWHLEYKCYMLHDTKAWRMTHYTLHNTWYTPREHADRASRLSLCADACKLSSRTYLFQTAPSISRFEKRRPCSYTLEHTWYRTHYRLNTGATCNMIHNTWHMSYHTCYIIHDTRQENTQTERHVFRCAQNLSKSVDGLTCSRQLHPSQGFKKKAL